MTPNPATCLTCGHLQSQHIYEEGECRPGFVCESKCEKFVETKPASRAREWTVFLSDGMFEAMYDEEELLPDLDEGEELVRVREVIASPDETSIPLEDVKKLCEALEYYQGNFNGKDGTKWRDGMLFVEDKFGSTEDASCDVASMALSTILNNFPQLKKDSE